MITLAPRVLQTISPLTILAVCLLFSIATLSTSSATLLQADFIDPYVYAAYIHDYAGTFQRFGHTYYSSRIAFIFVDSAFIKAFGDTTGPLVCRIILLTGASTAAFCIARRFFGFATGIIAIAWLCFIPWLSRSISWMYCDGFATTYTIVGLGLLLTPVRHRIIGHATAGFVFALAVNCNLHLIMIVGAFVPGWFLLNRDEGAIKLLQLSASALGGFLVGYITLQAAFSVAIGSSNTFLEAASLGTATSFLKSSSGAWFKTISQTISEGILIFLIPATSIVVGFLTLATNRTLLTRQQIDFGVAATLFATLSLAGMLFLHFAFSAGVMSLFFYQIYLLPGCLLILIFVSGTAAVRAPRITPLLALSIPITLLSLWFLREALDRPLPNDGWKWIWLWPFVIAGILSVSCFKPAHLTAHSALAALFVVTYGIIQWQPGVALQYAIWPGRNSQSETEREVYRGSVFLQKFVNAHVPPTSSIGFWYGEKPSDHTLNAVQSIFLWGYTRLHIYKGPSMPQVDSSFKMRVQQREYIAILARSTAEVNEALTTLKGLGIAYNHITQSQFVSSKEGYFVELLQLAKAGN